MDQENIKEEVKKRVEAKKSFLVVSFIFASISVILVAINVILYFTHSPADPSVHVWLLFPILILALVLIGIYLSIFGMPGSGNLSAQWEEEALHQVYLEKGLKIPPDTELSEEDRLELKELERLKQKWEERDDFV